MTSRLKTMLSLSALSISTLTLSGCGILGNQIDTDLALKDHTAESIGVPAKYITIVKRSGDLDSIHYVAKAKGKHYMCYYTTAIVYRSDAVCHVSNGKDSDYKSSCNALLSAAGRC